MFFSFWIFKENVFFKFTNLIFILFLPLFIWPEMY
uniref:Uncharacterized protein n=1 Tax=Anguilla anguilla TaxID=7936 RepID=A0A0E9UUP9_ANGAN